MELSPDAFDGLLSADNGFGQAVAWRQSDLCPCRSPTSGAAKPTCPTCGGKGVIWSAPQAAWTGLAGMKQTREWAAFGLWESGDVVLSIPEDSPLYEAGENDRVLMLQSSQPFRSVLTRAGNEVVVGGRIVEVDRVFWLDPTTQEVVEGNIPFIAPDGTMSWATGEPAPPNGMQYTIRGRRMPEYYVFQNFPQDRAHFGGLRLPRRVILRRFDLFNRGA